MRLGAALSLGLLALLIPAAPEAAASAPQLGRSFLVAPVGGAVRVKAAGSGRFVALARPKAIRVGSTVDATRGSVRLTGARSRTGGTYAGIFRGGAFRATQARRAQAVIVLRLVGGDGACASDPGRRLWGQAKGRLPDRGPLRGRDGQGDHLDHGGGVRLDAGRQRARHRDGD